MPAVSIPNVYALRHEIRGILGGGSSTWIPSEKRAELKVLVDEFDVQKFDEYSIDLPERFDGPGFSFSGIRQYFAKPKDPQKVKELLLRTGQLFMDSFVDPQLYSRLGASFRDLGMNIEDEGVRQVIEAVESGRNLRNSDGKFMPRRLLEAQYSGASKERLLLPTRF